MRELQLADPVLEKLQVWKGSEKKPEWCEIVHKGLEIKYYWHRLQLLCLREDVLYRRWESDDGREIKFLLLVPKTLRQFILSQLHGSTTGAHLGIEKTLFKVR